MATTDSPTSFPTDPAPLRGPADREALPREPAGRGHGAAARPRRGAAPLRHGLLRVLVEIWTNSKLGFFFPICSLAANFLLLK